MCFWLYLAAITIWQPIGQLNIVTWGISDGLWWKKSMLNHRSYQEPWSSIPLGFLFIKQLLLSLVIELEFSIFFYIVHTVTENTDTHRSSYKIQDWHTGMLRFNFCSVFWNLCARLFAWDICFFLTKCGIFDQKFNFSPEKK